MSQVDCSHLHEFYTRNFKHWMKKNKIQIFALEFQFIVTLQLKCINMNTWHSFPHFFILWPWIITKFIKSCLFLTFLLSDFFFNVFWRCYDNDNFYEDLPSTWLITTISSILSSSNYTNRNIHNYRNQQM